MTNYNIELNTQEAALTLAGLFNIGMDYDERGHTEEYEEVRALIENISVQLGEQEE